MKVTFPFRIEGKSIHRAALINKRNRLWSLASEAGFCQRHQQSHLPNGLLQLKIPYHMKRVIGQINPSWSVLWNINNLSELQSVLNLFRCPVRNESGMFSPVARELIFLHHKNYNLGYCSPCWQFPAETSKTEYASEQKWLNAGNSPFAVAGNIAAAIDRPTVLLHPGGGISRSRQKEGWRSLLYYCYLFWD